MVGVHPCAPPPAFETVHDRYRQRVLRYLTRLVGPGEAEDLTQDVMLKLSDGLPKFRGEATLSTWIYRIASNAAMDSFRRRRTQPATDPGVEVEPAADALALESSSLEEAAMQQEMRACVHEFVDRLPENYRMVLVLADLEGLGSEEIAAVLGLTVAAVKIRLHRARARLRAAFETGCSFERDRAGDFRCDRRPAAAPAAASRRP